MSTAPKDVYEHSITDQRIAEKLAEYNERFKNNDKDYEACICSAFTRLMSMGHNASVLTLVSTFGFEVFDKDWVIGFTRQLSDDIDILIRKNDYIDGACEVALPVLNSALADLEKIPKDWTCRFGASSRVSWGRPTAHFPNS